MNNQLNCWAETLLLDKNFGIGVDGIYSDRKNELPKGFYKTSIDDLEELDIMLISRLLGEAVWLIDDKLWTLDSININQGSEYKDVADVLKEIDIEPFLPNEIEHLCSIYKVGGLEPTEYMTAELKWYKKLREDFDEIDSNIKPIDETDEETINKELEFMNSLFSKNDGTQVKVERV